MLRGMVIDMNDEQLRTLADLQAFLSGTMAMDFTVAADERYEFIARTARRMKGTSPSRGSGVEAAGQRSAKMVMSKSSI